MTNEEALYKALNLAIKALKYCAIEPGYLQPLSNSQNAVAMNCLAEIEEILPVIKGMSDDRD